jgi:predicted alpha/beta hydrolase family esterase
MQVHEERVNSSETSLAGVSALVIQGWNGSGVGHWQTLWERKFPRFQRVKQHNWTLPARSDWMTQIDRDLDRGASPTFLVAHSLGCLAVARWAATAGKRTERVHGAFLVAPPWVTRGTRCPEQLADFLPMPLHRLPFPSLLVASKNDHYLPNEIAARLASALGSRFAGVGRQGHINVASGHGPWPTGEELLCGFVARIRWSPSRKTRQRAPGPGSVAPQSGTLSKSHGHFRFRLRD